jgi:hypothetical protein
MSVDVVWDLVNRARAEVTDPSDAEAVSAKMIELLSARSAAEITAVAQPVWDLLAASYGWDLWAAAYVINAGASDDGFEYFRGWLIAQGRDVFERSVADPDSLADHPAVIGAAEDGEATLECEAILGVAWTAYRIATGEELPAGTFTIDYPELGEGWDFDDASEMARRLPRLAALYDY